MSVHPKRHTSRRFLLNTAKTGSFNAPVSVLVMVFSCPVIEMMKSTVHSVCYGTTVDGIRSPLFNFLLQYLGKRIVILCTTMSRRLFLLIMFTSHFSGFRNCYYRMHYENTCHCSCCDNPSLDMYFDSVSSYFIYRQIFDRTLVLFKFFWYFCYIISAQFLLLSNCQKAHNSM